jgi:hypothetical protein
MHVSIAANEIPSLEGGLLKYRTCTRKHMDEAIAVGSQLTAHRFGQLRIAVRRECGYRRY